MKGKLTINNLRIFNSVNSTGQVVRTPEPSEVYELDSRYHLADWLYHFNSTGKKMKEKQYLWHVEYLDTIPLVGAYYRFLCAQNLD